MECADALSIAVLFCMIHLAQCCHSMRCCFRCFRWTFFCLCSGHKSATSLAVAVPPQLLFCDECVWVCVCVYVRERERVCVWVCVQYWRVSEKRKVIIQLSAAVGEFFREMWVFFWVPLSMSSYTTRWGWSSSFSELRTGRKVRKCRILTICAHLSISTYLSITWAGCNVSSRICLIFGLLVGRRHPHSVTQKIWHCCE